MIRFGGCGIIMNGMEKVSGMLIAKIYTTGLIKEKQLQQEGRVLKHFTGRGNTL